MKQLETLPNPTLSTVDASVEARSLHVASQNAFALAVSANAMGDTGAMYLGEMDRFASTDRVAAAICVTPKHTWTKTPVTVFGTHHQRPKEFAL